MKSKPEEKTKKAANHSTPHHWDEMNRKQRREMMRKIQSADLRLEVVHPNAGGIDIGNESHYVAVPPDRDSQPVQRFGCTTAELKAMADWLKQCGICTVAIAYASHCTSLGRCKTFSVSRGLFDNLTPRAFLGGSDPGSS
jgi:hypothetical protein